VRGNRWVELLFNPPVASAREDDNRSKETVQESIHEGERKIATSI